MSTNRLSGRGSWGVAARRRRPQTITFAAAVLILSVGLSNAGVPPEEHTGESPQIVVQSGHRNAIRGLSVAPDGRHLATVGGGEVKVWDRQGAIVWSASTVSEQSAVAWSPDNQTVVVGTGGTPGFVVLKGGESAGVELRDAQNGTVRDSLLRGNNTVDSVAYLTGNLLQVISDGEQVIWDLSKHKVVTGTFNGHVSRQPHGPYSAVQSISGIQLWDSTLKHQLASLWIRGVQLGPAAWSPSGHNLATFDGKKLRVWNLARRKVQWQLTISTAREQKTPNPRMQQPVCSVVWLPDGKTIAVAATWWPNAREVPNQGFVEGMPHTMVRLVTWPNGKITTLCPPEAGAVYELGITPRNHLVLAGGALSAVGNLLGSLTDVAINGMHPKEVWRAAGYAEGVNDLALSPDGNTLAVAGDDTAVRLWDWRHGILKQTLKRESTEVMAVSWSSEGGRIAALDLQHLVVWDPNRGTVIKVWKGLDDFLKLGNSVTWSPDGSRIAGGNASGMKVWNTATGAAHEPNRANVMEAGFGPLSWNKDGLWVSGGQSQIDPTTLKPIKVITGSGLGSEARFDGPVTSFEFYDHGKHLVAVGGDDKVEVKIWDVDEDVIERTIHGMSPLARCIKVAPNDQQCAIGDGQGGITMVDLHTLDVLWRRDAESPVADLEWSHDGLTLFAAGEDGRISLWNAQGVLRAIFLKLPQRPILSAGKAIRDGCGRDWLAWVPDGQYTGSQQAERHLRWRVGGALRPGTAFSNKRVAALNLG